MDRFIEARALAQRGGRDNLAKADRLCRELLADRPQANSAIHLLAAQICQLRGEPEDARRHYHALVEQNHPTAAQIAIYVGFVIEYGPPEEVERWLTQLDSLAPQDLGVVGLRANWLRIQGHSDQIEPLVEACADTILARQHSADPRPDAEVAQNVGDLYQRLGLYPAAERWYRRAVRSLPERYDFLAMAIARGGRIPEAMSVCEEAAKTDTSMRPIHCMTAILLSGAASPKDFDLAEALLKKGVVEHPDDPDLLVHVAGVRIVQNRVDEAIELYREVLRNQPDHFGALNNLAALLAERPDHANDQEALECIDRAIQLLGPRPEFLDTKAMILVYRKQPAEAVALLNEVTSVPHADPRAWFHLAVLAFYVTPCGFLGIVYCRLARRSSVGRNWIWVACAMLAVTAVFPGYPIRFGAPDAYPFVNHFNQFCEFVVPLAIGWWFLRRKRDQGQLQLAS